MESPAVRPVSLNYSWMPLLPEHLDLLIDLSTACFEEDGGLHFMAGAEELRERYFTEVSSYTTGAFDSAGRLVASGVVSLAGGAASIAGQVHPDCRGRGLGEHLMRWSLESARSLHGSSEPLPLQLRTEWLSSAAHRLYIAHGFLLADQSLVMRRDLDTPLPEAPLPDGITLTPWKSSLGDEFYRAWHAAFRARPGFPGYTSAAKWIDSWTTDQFRPEWSMLAREGKLPVGHVLSTFNPPHGFIMQVGVIPSHRRRGISSAMLVRSMRYMLGAGCESAQLTVNINNPGATESYSQIGFRAIGRRARYERML